MRESEVTLTSGLKSSTPWLHPPPAYLERSKSFLTSLPRRLPFYPSLNPNYKWKRCLPAGIDSDRLGENIASFATLTSCVTFGGVSFPVKLFPVVFFAKDDGLICDSRAVPFPQKTAKSISNGCVLLFILDYSFIYKLTNIVSGVQDLWCGL